MVFAGPQEWGWMLGAPQQRQRERGVVTATVANFANDCRVKRLLAVGDRPPQRRRRKGGPAGLRIGQTHKVRAVRPRDGPGHRRPSQESGERYREGDRPAF